MPETATGTREAHAQWENPHRASISHGENTQQFDKANTLVRSKRTSFTDTQRIPTGLMKSGYLPGNTRWFDLYEQRTLPADEASFDHISSERRQQLLELLRPKEDASLEEWSNYFDRHWKLEGLSKDWDTLRSLHTNKRVGFVIGREMASVGEPGDEDRLKKWFPKAERNLAGFKLEFLTDHIVYPRQYYRSRYDKQRLVDPFYGDGSEEDDRKSDIEALVSSEERNGVVKEKVGEIKRFLLDAPVGSLTVMVSPRGPTGFDTRDGLGEDYADSYIFIGLKNAKDKVMNYTIKTNFTLSECRAFISKVAGRELHPGASVEEYVAAIAKIKPGESNAIKNIFDVVKIMKQIHPEDPFVDAQTGKRTSWSEVDEDIKSGEKLYNFEKKANGILKKFREYGKTALHHSNEKIKKVTAAAALLLCDDFYMQKAQEALVQEGVLLDPNRGIVPGVIELKPIGNSVDDASERPGCTGLGGEPTAALTAGGERLTGHGEGKCPDCSQNTKNGHYHCTRCKEPYADERYKDQANRTPKCKKCEMPFGC